MTSVLLDAFQDSVLEVSVSSLGDDTTKQVQFIHLTVSQIMQFQLRHEKMTRVESLIYEIDSIVSSLSIVRQPITVNNSIGLDLANAFCAAWPNLQRPKQYINPSHDDKIIEWKIVPIQDGTWMNNKGEMGYTLKEKKPYIATVTKEKSLRSQQPQQSASAFLPRNKYTFIAAGSFGTMWDKPYPETDLLLKHMAEQIPADKLAAINAMAQSQPPKAVSASERSQRPLRAPWRSI